MNWSATFFKHLWITFRIALRTFISENYIRYSASLSYYTIFSLAPLLIITISLCGYIWGKQAMEGKIYSTISILAGKDAATQLQLMIQRIVSAEGSSFTRTVGVISMVLGLAAIFTEIQDSINRIWALKTTPKLDWKRYLIKRAISFGIFSIIGFVLVLSVLVNHFPAYFPLSRLKVPEQ